MPPNAGLALIKRVECSGEETSIADCNVTVAGSQTGAKVVALDCTGVTSAMSELVKSTVFYIAHAF